MVNKDRMTIEIAQSHHQNIYIYIFQIESN